MSDIQQQLAISPLAPGGAMPSINTNATNAFTQQATSIEEANLPPSKVQQYLSELFRIALCRNDDYNLAASSIIRNSKQYAQAKNNAA